MIGRPLALVLAVAIAPLQCGHAYDPALSKDETPGYALWQLAKRFHDQHDDDSGAAHSRVPGGAISGEPLGRSRSGGARPRA